MLEGAATYCDFVALTSHAHNPDAVAAQPQIIGEARATHPDLIVVNGLEWNTPTYELAAVLIPGGGDTMPLIDGLMAAYDRQVTKIEKSDSLFLEGLNYLAGKGSDDAVPGIILQHLHSAEDFGSVRSKAAFGSGIWIGISAASRRHLMDDGTFISPWAREVGGVLDRLFAEGFRLTMVGESDFHHHRTLDAHMGREWPGEFIQTFVYCPEKTESGLFAGLRAGSAYFVIANIIQDLEWRASAGNRWAMPGEEMVVPHGSTATVTVRCRENVPLESMELIGNPRGPIEVVASSDGDPLERSKDETLWRVELPQVTAPCFLRLRGHARAPAGEAEAAQFYANPLWIRPD